VLTWDPTKLQLDTTSIQKGTGIPGATTFTADTSTPGTLDVTANGTQAFTGSEMMIAGFKILAPSPSGTVNAINMPTASLTSTSGTPITIARRGGNVTTL
jgi:hypothetical protein